MKINLFLTFSFIPLKCYYISYANGIHIELLNISIPFVNLMLTVKWVTIQDCNQNPSAKWQARQFLHALAAAYEKSSNKASKLFHPSRSKQMKPPDVQAVCDSVRLIESQRPLLMGTFIYAHIGSLLPISSVYVCLVACGSNQQTLGSALI